MNENTERLEIIKRPFFTDKGCKVEARTYNSKLFGLVLDITMWTPEEEEEECTSSQK